MDVRNPIPTNGGYWLEKFGETWTAQVAQLKQAFGERIEKVRMPGVDATDVPIVYVNKSAVIDVLKYCKEQPAFAYNFLADLTATDEEADPRFEVVYNLYSTTKNYRFRIKTQVAEGESVPTLTGVWPAADWLEREVWDMFGVKFEGHPDLRRILMDVRWVGHPLRKDYPLKGYQSFTEPEPIDESALRAYVSNEAER